MNKDLRKALDVIDKNIEKIESNSLREEAISTSSNLKDIFSEAKLPMVLREFQETDWYGYGGAVRFEDGSEPMIACNDETSIIIDRNGIEVYICFDDECYLEYFTNITIQNKAFSIEIANKLTTEFNGMTPKDIVEHLRTKYNLKVESM